MTNNELVLCKVGCFIRKTWVVNNTGRDYWPENTGIVSVKANVEFRIPIIDANYLVVNLKS